MSPRQVGAAAMAASVFAVGVSWYVRQWRHQKLQELDYVNQTNFTQRNPQELIVTMERTGLMGITAGAKSVKEELEHIRQWHLEHGYKGGLVLRELTQPLFVHGDETTHSGTMSNLEHMLEDLASDPMRLARRECYYLYYEITGNGQIRQQIFCRGTTLAIDILTCLSLWMVYDEELGCRVHLGFRNQANRILDDIQPLLLANDDDRKRTTIEVSGHSLGGAVAFLVAAKLRKRGYQVVRVTSVGAPRFCATAASALILESLLPKDNLQIENDTDLVPYLPPFGHNVGNKLYLIDGSGAMAYIRSADDPNNRWWWVNSVFVNFRPWELLVARGQPHRVPYYVSHVKTAFEKSQ
jgi:hypothetical protein